MENSDNFLISFNLMTKAATITHLYTGPDGSHSRNLRKMTYNEDPLSQ